MILAIDVGKIGALVVMDESGIEEQIPYTFVSFNDFYKEIKKIVDVYKIKAIVTGKANRYNIVAAHYPWIGVMNLVAENAGIPVVLTNDTTCRAAVLGKGHGFHKGLAHETFKGETSDCSDAICIGKWLLMNQ